MEGPLFFAPPDNRRPSYVLVVDIGIGQVLSI